MTTDEFLGEFGLTLIDALQMLRDRGILDGLIGEFECGHAHTYNLLYQTFCEDLRARQQNPAFGPVELLSNNRARSEAKQGYLSRRRFSTTIGALEVVQKEWGTSILRDGQIYSEYIPGEHMKVIWSWEDLDAYVRHPRFPIAQPDAVSIRR